MGEEGQGRTPGRGIWGARGGAGADGVTRWPESGVGGVAQPSEASIREVSILEVMMRDMPTAMQPQARPEHLTRDGRPMGCGYGEAGRLIGLSEKRRA